MEDPVENQFVKLAPALPIELRIKRFYFKFRVRFSNEKKNSEEIYIKKIANACQSFSFLNKKGINTEIMIFSNLKAPVRTKSFFSLWVFSITDFSISNFSKME